MFNFMVLGYKQVKIQKMLPATTYVCWISKCQNCARRLHINHFKSLNFSNYFFKFFVSNQTMPLRNWLSLIGGKEELWARQDQTVWRENEAAACCESGSTCKKSCHVQPSHATCNVQLRQPTSCMLPNHCLSESGRWLAKKSFHGTWRLFFTASFFQYLRIGVAGEPLILVNSLFSLEICKVVCLKIFRMAVLVLIFRFAPCATYRVFFKLVPP